MNKYLLYLKNPKIWGIILLLIAVIVAIVIIIINLKPAPVPNSKFCGSSKIKTTCPDKSIQCADICPEDQIWSCIAPGSSGEYGACVCRDKSLKMCNQKSECCPTCVNDMCCDAKNQAIYTDDTGKLIKKCCPPTTIPGITGEGCLSLCGASSIPCPKGQFCMQIAGLTGSDFTDALNYSKKDQSYRSDDGSTIYACAIPSKCEFGISSLNIAPYNSPIGGLSSYYNTDNIMKDTTDNICIPNNSQDYGSTGSVCYKTDHQYKESCTTPDCTWLSSFDILNEDRGMDTLKKHMGAIMYNDNKSDLGYYCGKDNERWIQYKQLTKESGTCNWQDCLRQVDEIGITRISWDGEKCLALKSNKNSGIRGSVQCTDVGVPCPSCNRPGDYSNCVLCKDVGNPCQNCTKAGEYVDDCDLGLWEFTDCKDDPNMVLSSFADQGKTCNQGGTICGNCAWGGNNPSSISPFGKEGLQSGIKSDYNVYCVNDGQIYTDTIPIPPNNCDNNLIPTKNGICVFPCTASGEDARDYTDNSYDEENKKLFKAIKNPDKTISCFRNIIPFLDAKFLCNHDWEMGNCQDNTDQNHIALAWFEDEDNKYKLVNACTTIAGASDCVVNIKDTIPFNPPTDIPDLPKYYFPKNGREWDHDSQWPYRGWPLNLWNEGKPSDNFLYATNMPNDGTDWNYPSHPQLENQNPNDYMYGKYQYVRP
jgi:hypothetical protein